MSSFGRFSAKNFVAQFIALTLGEENKVKNDLRKSAMSGIQPLGYELYLDKR